MEDESLKPNLLEKGTRWDHYNELRDLFASGVEILSTLKVKTSSDQDKMVKLRHAAEMIEGRLNYITDFTQKTGWSSPIRLVVDGEVDNLYRKMKHEREKANATSDKKQDRTDDDGESPASYTTK
jgi:hypothetical protein